MTLDELKKLEQAATPEPWKPDRETGFCHVYKDGKRTRSIADTGPTRNGSYGSHSSWNNTQLIAASRNMLPKLIAVAEAAKIINRSWNAGIVSYDKNNAHNLNRALEALEGEG